MPEISTFRLYLLRGGYLLIAVGLAVMIFPGIISPPGDLPHMNSVVRSMLTAVSLLAFLGVRYPLKMLPVLLFELLWKSVWLVAFGRRLLSANALDPGTAETLNDTIFGIAVVLIVMPWSYVFNHYVKAPGDRWLRRTPSMAAE